MNVHVTLGKSSVNLNTYQMQGYVDTITKFEISDLSRRESILKCTITFEDKDSINIDLFKDNVSLLIQGIEPEKVINNSSLDTLGLRVITEGDRKITDMFVSQLNFFKQL